MKVGSLFSGIGGLDLGLEAAGMEVIWQSEIDPYASQVLAKHWPAVPNLGDIRTIDWSNVERPDLICGGYPCQPFSLAGNRQGTDDPRHLWPEMFRAVSVLRPRYALLENVPGHVTLGFDQVLADLASIGFDAEWDIIPACAVGAPHRRDRLWIVAYPSSARRRENPGSTSGDESPDEGRGTVHDHVTHCDGQSRKSWHVADPICERLERPEHARRDRKPITTVAAFNRSEGAWGSPQPPICGMAHGIPARVHRLRTLGNAVVPQVAEFVGRRILEAVR